MAKAKKGVFLKRALFLAVPAIIALVLLIRFLNNSKAADLQNLLQNLPKEISQSINSAASNQKSDADLLKQFEALAADIKKKHEEQARQFEKERKALQKQIHELKQVPEQATLREKLVYAFRYDTKRKFPAYIWQSSLISTATRRISWFGREIGTTKTQDLYTKLRTSIWPKHWFAIFTPPSQMCSKLTNHCLLKCSRLISSNI